MDILQKISRIIEAVTVVELKDLPCFSLINTLPVGCNIINNTASRFIGEDPDGRYGSAGFFYNCDYIRAQIQLAPLGEDGRYISNTVSLDAEVPLEKALPLTNFMAAGIEVSYADYLARWSSIDRCKGVALMANNKKTEEYFLRTSAIKNFCMRHGFTKGPKVSSYLIDGTLMLDPNY